MWDEYANLINSKIQKQLQKVLFRMSLEDGFNSLYPWELQIVQYLCFFSFQRFCKLKGTVILNIRGTSLTWCSKKTLDSLFTYEKYILLSSGILWGFFPCHYNRNISRNNSEKNLPAFVFIAEWRKKII